MLKVENTDVYGFEAAIRGTRNPMNSWDKSDSYWCEEDCPHVVNDTEPALECNNGEFGYCLGVNDLKLMTSLSKAGNDHGKFLRMINVTCDIIAPLYWWKEFDTYKVGTVANSCSTMHKIHDKEFTLDDFSCEHLTDYHRNVVLDGVIIKLLNTYRRNFIEAKNKNDWWQMIQLLPSSYNQKRTVQLNYQVLKSMYFARRNHRLDEWHTLCEWMESLPYFKEIVIQE